MDVYDVKISKQHLQALPDNERLLVVQFGHAYNELSFLNKLLLMVSDTSTTGIERTTMVAQSMIVIRLYSGKVFEAWEMVRRDYLKNPVSRDYDKLLSSEGKSALQYAKTYFGGSNLLATIRNEFAFHYGRDHIDRVMSTFTDDWNSTLILGDAHANTLHRFSEDFAMVGMLVATDLDNPQEAMDKIVGDLSEAGGKLVEFFGHALAAVFERRLGKTWDDFVHTKHTVYPKAHLESFKIPFFLSVENEP
jgi:hypothetical protein